MTAHSTYQERFFRCKDLIRKLEKKLDAHSDLEERDQRNWGWSGDLQSLEAALDEAIAQLATA